MPDPPGPKCRVCDDPPYIEFNWRLAQADKDLETHALAGELKPVRGLKFGFLYSHPLCGQHWILDDDQYFMTRLPRERAAIVEEWDKTRLVVPQEQLRVLYAIGATAPRYWAGRDCAIAVPCAITMNGGERVDPAIVWITRRPPIDGFVARARLYRGVAAVEPSRFALPLDVRRATVLAPEASMGFSPTRVVAGDGTPFVLHWATSLFDQAGIAGSQIRLSAKRYDRNEPITVAEADSTHATHFYADWFDGAQELDRTRTRSRLFSILTALRRSGRRR